MKDMDSHVGTVNVFIAEMADFAGGTHEGSHCLLFDVRDGANKFKSLFLRGYKRETGIKPAFGKLGIIPGFMEDIQGKKAEL